MSKLKSAYNLYDAKNSFSELIERVQAGEEVVIMKRGEPVAKLIPVDARKIRFGTLRDKIKLSPGWDAPIDDFEETWQEHEELYGPAGQFGKVKESNPSPKPKAKTKKPPKAGKKNHEASRRYERFALCNSGSRRAHTESTNGLDNS